VCYFGPAIVHFTLCTYCRRPWFADHETAVATRKALQTAIVDPLVLEAFCFMPDHLHALITNTGCGDVRAPVVRFKQISGYRHRQRTGCILWQAGYFDHILRREEDLAATIRYIVGNPVRRGLCDDWREWTWSWSRWPLDG
jgi:REP element-mobilizing transposase RayT